MMFDNDDDSHDENLPRKAPADFDGPAANRRCTDILCLIMILGMWAAMTVVGIYSWAKGDYRVVLYPMDYDGNVCGTTFKGRDMTDFPKLVYVNNLSGGVCVKECPQLENLTDIHTLITYSGVYQGENATLPANYVEVADYSNATNRQECDLEKCPTDPSKSFESPGILRGNSYAYYAVDTYEVLDVRCLANPKAIKEVQAQVYIPDGNILDVQEVDDAATFFSHLYADCYTAASYVAIGFALALVLGFCYAQLLRLKFLLGAMIWGSIAATLGIIFGVAVYTNVVSRDWENEEPREKEDNVILYTKVFSYVLFGIGAFFLFLIIFLRKDIQLAMACVKQAARAVGAMPLMTAFPVVLALGIAAFMYFWFTYAVHLASLGNITTKTLPTNAAVSMRSYEYDDFIKRTGWYLVFCLFWTAEFISTMGGLIIAMSVAKWYFTRDKKSVGSGTFIKSIPSSLYYHTGTVAFGSLLVAIVQLIRAILARIQEKARELDNKLGEALLCCCQCCLWCFEKFIKFMNKNAYIQTAIHGTSFCTSARRAFMLILRNAGRVTSITYVSAVVLFVGKLFISFMTAGLSYMLIDRQIGDDLHSAGGPTLLIFFLSFKVADMFLDVFEMSTATILQCFIADEEMFDGDENYADGSLRKWLDDYDETEKKVRGLE